MTKAPISAFAVAVTLRDSSATRLSTSSVNYNLNPATTPNTQTQDVTLGGQGQGYDEYNLFNEISHSLPGLQYRPKSLDELSYHEELTTRLRSLVSVLSPLLDHIPH